MLCPSHSPWLDHSNYVWRGVQVMNNSQYGLENFSVHCLLPKEFRGLFPEAKRPEREANDSRSSSAPKYVFILVFKSIILSLFEVRKLRMYCCPLLKPKVTSRPDVTFIASSWIFNLIIVKCMQIAKEEVMTKWIPCILKSLSKASAQKRSAKRKQRVTWGS
jgi:hypothetical protein